MKLSKKQMALIHLIEKCGFLLRDEVCNQQFPDSLIDALIDKGMIAEFNNKLTSTTK